MYLLKKPWKTKLTPSTDNFMLDKIDNFILKMYQSLIDMSQKHPNWWIEQSGYATMIFGAINVFLRPSPDGWVYFGMLLDMLCGAVFLIVARNSQLILQAGKEHFMRSLIFMLTIGILIGYAYRVYDNFQLYLIPCTIRDVIYMSFWYFAACKPPAPPKKKEKLALASSLT